MPTAPDSVCSRCGGQRVDVRVGGVAELVATKFNRKDRSPKGWKGVVGLTGVACTTCGHVELYATEPERLAEGSGD